MDAIDLRTVRRESGLTQRQLAERTGLAQSTIARIETGLTSPTLETVERVLSAMDRRLAVVRTRGVDRSQLIRRLNMSPTQRIAANRAALDGIKQLRGRT